MKSGYPREIGSTQYRNLMKSCQYEIFDSLYNMLMPMSMLIPFNKTFIYLLSYYFFYPKYVLLRLLKFLFVKQTLNFLSVIISYFICHWNCQLNFRNFENLFRPSFSLSVIKYFHFLCYSNIITN